VSEFAAGGRDDAEWLLPPGTVFRCLSVSGSESVTLFTVKMTRRHPCYSSDGSEKVCQDRRVINKTLKK
jgi:hypothetical protein